MSTLLEHLRSSARPYLFALILAVVLGGLVQYLYKYAWSSIPVVLGQEPDVYVTAIVTAVAAGLWLLYRGERTRQPLLVAFLGLLVLAWVVHSLLSRVHVDAVLYTVLLYVPAVIAVWWKTPTREDLLSALKLLGWSFVLILVAIRSLELLGVLSPIYVGDRILSYELRNYWLPLSDTIGPVGRWHGPFGHAGKTGAASAFLIVLAAGMRGHSRWVFAFVGILGLLLTASRGSMIAAAGGVLAIVVFGSNPITRRVRRLWLLLGVGAVALSGLTAVLLRNPDLTGRTTYWSVAIEVWLPSPVIGVGNSGMQASDLAMAGTNAHNIAIDSLVKYGIIGLLPVLAILVVAGVLAIRSCSAGEVLPLGIVTTYLVLGISEADTEWMKITLPWLWLFLASVLAGRVLERQEADSPALSSAGT